MLEIVDVKERGPKGRHSAREVWGRAPPSLRAHSCFGENLCCDCRCRVLVALNNFRLSTPGHEVGSFVNPIVPKNFEIS